MNTLKSRDVASTYVVSTTTSMSTAIVRVPGFHVRVSEYEYLKCLPSTFRALFALAFHSLPLHHQETEVIFDNSKSLVVFGQLVDTVIVELRCMIEPTEKYLPVQVRVRVLRETPSTSMRTNTLFLYSICT